LICEKHSMLVEFSMTGNNVVKIISSIERTIRNKSAYAHPIKNYVHVDEWGYESGMSEILECLLEIEGQTFAAPSNVRDAFTVRADTEEKSLQPDQVAKMRSKWVEYKNINDDLYYNFNIPTIDPEIEVRSPPELESVTGFGTLVQNIESYQYVPR